MEVMLVSRVDTKVVSSVLVAVLMLVTERVTEVMETTSDSIEVDVVDSSTASVNIYEVWVNALSYWKLSTIILTVILLMRVTSSTDSALVLLLPVLVPAKIDDTRVVACQ